MTITVLHPKWPNPLISQIKLCLKNLIKKWVNDLMYPVSFGTNLLLIFSTTPVILEMFLCSVEIKTSGDHATSQASNSLFYKKQRASKNPHTISPPEGNEGALQGTLSSKGRSPYSHVSQVATKLRLFLEYLFARGSRITRRFLLFPPVSPPFPPVSSRRKLRLRAIEARNEVTREKAPTVRQEFGSKTGRWREINGEPTTTASIDSTWRLKTPWKWMFATKVTSHVHNIIHGLRNWKVSSWWVVGACDIFDRVD